MSRALADLYRLLVAFVPWQVAAALVGLVVLAAAPYWFEGVRERQVRGYVRRMVRADATERAALSDRVRAMAEARPSRLPRVAEAAQAYGQHELLAWALVRLRADDPALAARFDQAPPRRRDRDPLEAVVRVEGLLAEGLAARASEVLEEARRTWPDDPELAALSSRLPRTDDPASPPAGPR